MAQVFIKNLNVRVTVELSQYIRFSIDSFAKKQNDNRCKLSPEGKNTDRAYRAIKSESSFWICLFADGTNELYPEEFCPNRDQPR